MKSTKKRIQTVFWKGRRVLVDCWKPKGPQFLASLNRLFLPKKKNTTFSGLPELRSIALATSGLSCTRRCTLRTVWFIESPPSESRKPQREAEVGFFPKGEVNKQTICGSLILGCNTQPVRHCALCWKLPKPWRLVESYLCCMQWVICFANLPKLQINVELVRKSQFERIILLSESRKDRPVDSM